MSDNVSPDIKQSWETMQREMPNETAATNRVMEMGPISRFFNPNAYAVANPFLRTIGINKQLIDQDKADIPSTLAHELTHINQGPMGFLKNIFNKQPLEDEAYNAEDMRRRNRLNYKRDINLPVMK